MSLHLVESVVRNFFFIVPDNDLLYSFGAKIIIIFDVILNKYRKCDENFYWCISLIVLRVCDFEIFFADFFARKIAYLGNKA